MKVSELKAKIESWESEGKVNEQTVEFVIGSKKHFAKDVKAGMNTMVLDVTRSQYTPLTLASLKTNLGMAASETEVKVLQDGSEKAIEDLYLSADFLEFIIA